jgi:hypothetical protein
MAVETKELVREYWAMGFSVKDSLAVLQIAHNRNFTWDQVYDMYEQLEKEEKHK